MHIANKWLRSEGVRFHITIRYNLKTIDDETSGAGSCFSLLDSKWDNNRKFLAGNLFLTTFSHPVIFSVNVVI